MRQPSASVVICTRNRCKTLLSVCRAVLGLDYPTERWELIIVDNLSTDSTLELARELEREHPDLVRVHVESEIGLSAARNSGARLANGEIVAFLDDDAFPKPDWLQALTTALSRNGALAAGGPVKPLFQGERPSWLSETYLPYLSAWDRGRSLHRLTYPEYPRGTNMAFRREVFARFGGFSTDLGRKGKSLLSCEEIELCLRIERGGGDVVYVPDAGVGHLTAVDRLRPRWLLRRFASQGRSEAVIDWMHAGISGLLRGLRRYAKNALWAVQNRDQDGGRLLARCQCRALAGYLRGLLTAWTVPRYRPKTGEVAAPWRRPN